LETLPDILQNGTPKRDTFRETGRDLWGWWLMQGLEECSVVRDLVGLFGDPTTNGRRG